MNAAAPALAATGPRPRLRDTQPMPASPSRFSILLVDDDAVNRLSLGLWLEKKGGFRVATAADGAEALRRLRGEPFDLVVLDVMMPVMDGLEVLRRLRQSYSSAELPVVMATSRDRTEDMVEAFELGANDYVTKPIDFPVALARVRVQLRAKERARRRPKSLPPGGAQEIKPGSVLEGRYRLDEMIGAGSNGAVYRATHLNLDRRVAVKILHTGLGDDEVALERLQQEGISACRVDHPNAVAVLDFNASPSGLVFLVMELLHGHSLSEEIRRRGRLSPERTAEIVLPICDVLAEAHAVGILHRDVKPQNTFLHQSRRGEIVKVLDFGLAKLLEDKVMDDDPTHDGIAGTLAYLAPERITAERYDGRADVYSLGVTLYEMLSGELPFMGPEGNPVEMMMKHVRETPPSLVERVPELDPAIEAVVLQALEKDPRLRPTAAELKERLAAAVGVPPDQQPLGLAEQSGFMLRALLEQELSEEITVWRERRRKTGD
jgi:DNA-binding response OmpR family regulator